MPIQPDRPFDVSRKAPTRNLYCREVHWSSDLWWPSLVAAVVAAVVTLCVEYAAKPRLEARKERILTAQRTKRETIALLNLADSNYGMTRDLLKGAPLQGEAREVPESEMRHLRNELTEQGRELVRLGRLLHDDRDPLVFRFISRAAGMYLAVGKMGPEKVDEDALTTNTTLALELLRHPRWTLSGRRLRERAQAWLETRTPRVPSPPE